MVADLSRQSKRSLSKERWLTFPIGLMAALGLLLAVHLFDQSGATPLLAQTDGDRGHGFNQTRYYTIQPGDTIYSIALELGIDLDDTYCLVDPGYTWSQPLVIGDVLEVPPPSVICHEIQPGETRATIAALYDIPISVLQSESWNRLPATGEATLIPGHHLRVAPLETTRPVTLDAAKEELAQILALPANSVPFIAFAVGNDELTQPEVAVPPHWPYGSGNFRWPTQGWLSQGFHLGHRAIDIAAPLGSPVRAADRGVVIRAGWNNQGYGNLVIIDHQIDYVTLYGHLSEIYVTDGQIVGAGDLIGAVGSTGNSTGPHLHFEIRDFGQLSDPLVLLTR